MWVRSTIYVHFRSLLYLSNKSVIDKVASNQLAPSSTLVHTEVLAVLQYCLNIPFGSLEEFAQQLSQLCSDHELSIPTHCGELCQQYSKLITPMMEHTPDLHLKEANGYPVLGAFAIVILQTLKRKYPDKIYFCRTIVHCMEDKQTRS